MISTKTIVAKIASVITGTTTFTSTTNTASASRTTPQTTASRQVFNLLMPTTRFTGTPSSLCFLRLGFPRGYSRARKTRLRRLLDRAGSSPAESFVTSQAKTHPYGCVDPGSVKRRVVKRGGAALFYDRTPCADTRRMGKCVAAGRKQEIGSHTPASGAGMPIRATARVVNVRRTERGWRSTRDAVRSRTSHGRIPYGTQVVGRLALHRRWHHSSYGQRARWAVSAPPNDRLRHWAVDRGVCET